MKFGHFAGALSALLVTASAPRALEPADVVYRGGRIYTVDERRPWAEAVAVRGGRFVGVGTSAEMARFVGASTKIVDLGGRLVIPGLVDAHTHPSFEAQHAYDLEAGFPWSFLRRHHRLLALLPATTARRVAAIQGSLRIMSSYGITAFGEGKTEAPLLPVWEEALRARPLRHHVVMYLHALDAAGLPKMRHAAQILAAFQQYRLPGVRVGAKIFVDGYLEYRTARLVEPYRGGSGGRGMLNAAPAVIRELIGELDRAGIPVQAHAIGDGAVRLALDAFEESARRRADAQGPVHCVVHARLVHPDDLPRFARLGVVPLLYPFLAQPYPGNRFLDDLLGKERVERDYLPLGLLWRAGAAVAIHSDWASASMNPFHGMYVGVTRRSPHHPERGQLGAANALTLEQMVRAYSLHGAMALGMEREAGSIEPGKWADMAVLDRDVFRRPVEELLETHVVKTVFEGNVVYDAADPLPPALQTVEDDLLELGREH